MGKYPELTSKYVIVFPWLSYIIPSPVDKIVIGAGCCAQGRACLLLQTPYATTDIS